MMLTQSLVYYHTSKKIWYCNNNFSIEQYQHFGIFCFCKINFIKSNSRLTQDRIVCISRQGFDIFGGLS